MELNVGKEIAAMDEMTVAQLRNHYAEVFGETTNARNKQWLLKKIIWRLQSLAEGDLSERARARAREIVSDADIRRRPPQAPALIPDALRWPPLPVQVSPDQRVPIPGSTIIREYKGRRLEVLVLDDGFEYAGEKFKSLSGVAKWITGFHCNGYRLLTEAVWEYACHACSATFGRFHERITPRPVRSAAPTPDVSIRILVDEHKEAGVVSQ